MSRILGLAFFAALLVAATALAGVDTYEFDDPAAEVRFQALTEQLRCPKCQNQNIADSDAPLAADLREKVYRMILDGQSDAGIVDYMVQRYGNFVSYLPPVVPATWALWYGPFIGLGLAAVVLAVWVRRRSRQAPATLSEQDRQRLSQLLEKR